MLRQVSAQCQPTWVLTWRLRGTSNLSPSSSLRQNSVPHCGRTEVPTSLLMASWGLLSAPPSSNQPQWVQSFSCFKSLISWVSGLFSPRLEGLLWSDQVHLHNLPKRPTDWRPSFHLQSPSQQCLNECLTNGRWCLDPGAGNLGAVLEFCPPPSWVNFVH